MNKRTIACLFRRLFYMYVYIYIPVAPTFFNHFVAPTFQGLAALPTLPALPALPAFSMLFFLNASAASANEYSRRPTPIELSAELIERPDCARELESRVAESFDALKAEGGHAFLGEFSELSDLLNRSGVSIERSTQIVAATEKLRLLTKGNSELEYVSRVMEEMIQSEQLAICVTSEECTLSHLKQNQVASTNSGESMIVIALPSSTLDPLRWGVKFFATVAQAAGERLLDQWTTAGATLETFDTFNTFQIKPRGKPDALYQRFASAHIPRLMERTQNLDSRFVYTFLALYRSRVAGELLLRLYPQQALENTRRVGETVVHYLTSGDSSLITSPIVNEFGINGKNALTWAGFMTATMRDTIARANLSRATKEVD